MGDTPSVLALACSQLPRFVLLAVTAEKPASHRQLVAVGGSVVVWEVLTGPFPPPKETPQKCLVLDSLG